MRAYSVDLRQRIVQAIEGGMSQTEAARVFRVGQSTVKRYVQQYRRQGSLSPKTTPGRSPTIGIAELTALRQQVLRHPDATLAEHVRMWAREHHTLVSISTMSRALRAIGWSRPRRR